MHAHRIDVLDAADDDAVVVRITDDLELVFLPTEQRLVDQDLGDHRRVETAPDDVVELLEVVGDATTRTTQGVGRSDDRGKTDLLEEGMGFIEIFNGLRKRLLQSDLVHDLVKDLTILGASDDVTIRTDHPDTVLLENALIMKFTGTVQGRLTSEGRQQGVDGRALVGLPLHDLFNGFGRDRLDVGSIAQRGVGHDRRGVGVHQHDSIAVLTQSLAGLRSGIVELTALPDHDGAGTDQEDRMDVISSRHLRLIAEVFRKEGPNLRQCNDCVRRSEPGDRIFLGV